MKYVGRNFSKPEFKEELEELEEPMTFWSRLSDEEMKR